MQTIKIEVLGASPQLGQSFNSVLGELQVQTAGSEEQILGVNQSKSSLIRDSKSFMNAFQVSGSLQVKLLSIPVGGSVSGDYKSTVDSNENSIFYLYTFESLFRTIQLKVGKMEWHPPKTVDTAAGLYNRFGDSYVSSITYGAKFFCLCQIQCNSNTEKEALSGSLTATVDFKAVSGELKGEISKNISNVTSKNSMTFEIKTIGGPKIEKGNPSSFEEMLEIADKWGKNLGTEGTPLSFSYSYYSQLAGFVELPKSSPLPLSATREFINGELATEILEWKALTQLCESIAGSESEYLLNGSPATVNTIGEIKSESIKQFETLKNLYLSLRDSVENGSNRLPTLNSRQYIGDHRLEHQIVRDVKVRAKEAKIEYSKDAGVFTFKVYLDSPMLKNLPPASMKAIIEPRVYDQADEIEVKNFKHEFNGAMKGVVIVFTVFQNIDLAVQIGTWMKDMYSNVKTWVSLGNCEVGRSNDQAPPMTGKKNVIPIIANCTLERRLQLVKDLGAVIESTSSNAHNMARTSQEYELLLAGDRESSDDFMNLLHTPLFGREVAGFLLVLDDMGTIGLNTPAFLTTLYKTYPVAIQNTIAISPFALDPMESFDKFKNTVLQIRPDSKPTFVDAPFRNKQCDTKKLLVALKTMSLANK